MVDGSAAVTFFCCMHCVVIFRSKSPTRLTISTKREMYYLRAQCKKPLVFLTVSGIAFAVDDDKNYLKLWELLLSHFHIAFQVTNRARPVEK
jgi:hypothetical protein